jgi:hypothetical protein
MSLVARVLKRGDINFPSPGGRFIIEDNPGDDWPIHIHIGPKEGHWSVRIHFTYEEFNELIEKMKEEKEEYGSRY